MTTNPRGPLKWAPPLPNHWEVVPLNTVAKMGTGHTPDRNKPEYWQNCDIPWVTTPDVTKRPNSLAPLLDTEQKISRQGLANSAATVHPADTVMLSRTASVGYSVRIGVPMATTQAFVTWTAGPRLDPRYLLLVFRAMSQEWKRLAYGSTHLTIYLPDLESLRIPLPPLDEQRRIADFLDVKIRHMEEFTKARTRSIQLNEERYNTLTESSLWQGGYEQVPLKWVAGGITVGVVVNPSTYVEPSGTVRFFRGVDIKRFQMDLTGAQRISVQANAVLRKSILRTGDLVSIRVGEPGITAVVPPEADGSNCASVLIIRKSPAVNSKFLCHALNSITGRRQWLQLSVGAAQKQVNVSAIGNFLTPKPDLSDQDKLASFLDEAREEMIGLKNIGQAQINLLAERRQALVTAAVTGQLDVTTARPGIQ